MKFIDSVNCEGVIKIDGGKIYVSNGAGQSFLK